MIHFIRKPIIIVPTIIALLLTGLISLVLEFNEVIGISFLLISVALMLVSFIEALISKKWLKAFLYFISHTVLSLIVLSIAFSWIMFKGANTPYQWSDETYNTKLNHHLKTTEEFKLKTICKEDEIYESFTGDLDASCVFQVSNSEYQKLLKEIKKNNQFEKMKISEFEHKIQLDISNCDNNISYNSYGYQSVSGSTQYSTLVFTNDKKSMLFNIPYF